MSTETDKLKKTTMLIKICELFIGTTIILDNKYMSVLTSNHIYKFPSGIHCDFYIKINSTKHPAGKV